MGKTHYTKIKYKGNYEYIWDSEGKYIRKNGKFIIDRSNKSIDDKLKAEFNKLVKGLPYIKQRVKNIKNLEKKIYYAKVWILTEQNDLTKLRNQSKRGFRKYHLDHQYPISEGFKNDIPAEVISDIENLRFIHFRKNLKKRDSVTPEAIKLINSIKRKLNK